MTSLPPIERHLLSLTVEHPLLWTTPLRGLVILMSITLYLLKGTDTEVTPSANTTRKTFILYNKFQFSYQGLFLLVCSDTDLICILLFVFSLSFHQVLKWYNFWSKYKTYEKRTCVYCGPGQGRMRGFHILFGTKGWTVPLPNLLKIRNKTKQNFLPSDWLNRTCRAGIFQRVKYYVGRR